MNNQAMKQTTAKAAKPKPPLTAYNLYFQVERKRILEGTDCLGLAISHEEIKIAALQHKAKTGKRLHRKTHGKIGFKELARVVADRWKKLDFETKKKLEENARMEKEEYMELLEQWKKSDEYKQDIVKIQRDEKNFREISFQNVPPRLSNEMQKMPLASPDLGQSNEFNVGQMSEFELFQCMWKELVSQTPEVSQDKSEQCASGLTSEFSHQ